MRRIASVVLAAALTVGAVGVAGAQAQQTRRIYAPGGDVSVPKVIRQVQPVYTKEGLAAKVQGEVELEVVVLTDGSVGDVRVAKSLDRQFGLDEQAIEVARLWRFEPSRLAGVAVPVRITMLLEFRIHAASPGQDRTADFEAGAYRAGAPGVMAPAVKRQVNPMYTAAALREKIQGVVGVEVVVMPDGTVARSRVVESLDTRLGLDAEAEKAAQRWTFEPGTGTLNGQPAPIIVRLNLEFKIH